MRGYLSIPSIALYAGVLAACGGSSPDPTTSQPAAANRPASPPAAASQTGSERDRSLAVEVERFLDAWVVRRDPKAAVVGRVAATFMDELFLPPRAFAPSQRRATGGSAEVGTPISADRFETALQQHLESRMETGSGSTEAAEVGKEQGLRGLLAPFSPDQAHQLEPQVWESIGGRSPRALSVAGVPSIVYQVRGWDDISWTASPVEGYQVKLDDVIARNRLDVQAVVTRLKAVGGAPESLIVTLWSDEGRQGGEWRFAGVELPRSQ